MKPVIVPCSTVRSRPRTARFSPKLLVTPVSLTAAGTALVRARGEVVVQGDGWRARAGVDLARIAEQLEGAVKHVAMYQGALAHFGSRPHQPAVDLAAQLNKIDRLGQERLGASFDGFTPCRVITIGGDHDDGDVRPGGLRPWQ